VSAEWTRERLGGVRPATCLRWGTCLLVLVLEACSSKDPPASAVPAERRGLDGAGGGAETEKAEEAADAEAIEPEPTLGELDARVDQAWSELEALDEARAKAATSPQVDSDAAARCERIHGLAAEICTLRDKLCSLATQHPGHARYANACMRSEDTCGRARQAAARCPAR
jgi:hypothetical protein